MGTECYHWPIRARILPSWQSKRLAAQSCYTVFSRDGLYTITASSDGVSASRTLIQADHGNTPFETVGLAFDEETQQLASAPSFFQVNQFTALVALQPDHTGWTMPAMPTS
jgi:hypothetical protein